MKKLTGILLVLLLLTMTGCGSDNGTESDVKVENEENTESTTETVESSETEFNTSATIEETVIYDQDGITITVTGVEYGSWAGETTVDLNVMINNNSDQILKFFSNTFGYYGNKINGIEIIGGLMDAQFLAGGSDTITVSFYSSNLMEKGIYSIKEIQLAIYKRGSDYVDVLLDTAPIYTNLH